MGWSSTGHSVVRLVLACDSAFNRKGELAQVTWWVVKEQSPVGGFMGPLAVLRLKKRSLAMNPGDESTWRMVV